MQKSGQNRQSDFLTLFPAAGLFIQVLAEESGKVTAVFESGFFSCFGNGTAVAEKFPRGLKTQCQEILQRRFAQRFFECPDKGRNSSASKRRQKGRMA